MNISSSVVLTAVWNAQEVARVVAVVDDLGRDEQRGRQRRRARQREYEAQAQVGAPVGRGQQGRDAEDDHCAGDDEAHRRGDSEEEGGAEAAGFGARHCLSAVTQRNN